MSHPFGVTPLWQKAKIFMERGLTARSEGRAEEWPLWASLAAELLGKAVLSQIHPTLVAHPGSDEMANSLLSAAGVNIQEGGLQSIQMKTVLLRLAKILPAHFDKDVQKGLKLVADFRNEELHSGAIPFVGLKESAWAPYFWRAIDILLRELKRSVQDLVGPDFESLVVQFIEATKQELESEVKKMLGEAKQRWKVRSSDNGGEEAYRSEINEKFEPFQELTVCPVCGCSGILAHSNVKLSSYRKAEDYGVVVESIFRADRFQCGGCSLDLKSTAHLAIAGLPVDVRESEYSTFQGEPEWNDRPEREEMDDYGND